MVAGVIARGRLKNKQTYKHSVQFHLQPRSEAEWKESLLWRYNAELKSEAVLRWRRNRTERPLSPHKFIERTLNAEQIPENNF
jgi:hypothetical protein